jgi:dsDNA-specific endonuclease/ATPase MutS2
MTFLEWLKRWRLRTVSRPRENGEQESGAPLSEDWADVDPFNPFPEPVRLEITDSLDLHTVPPREVRQVVAEYLRQARLKGFRSVRIIHGKGRGVQREIVRSVLAQTSFVKGWADAPPAAGGWGATVAHLSMEE